MRLSIKDNGLFIIETDDEVSFVQRINDIQNLVKEGNIEQACQCRLDNVQQIVSLFVDDVQEADMSDSNTFSAVQMMAQSVRDHFCINDFEMVVNLGELVLEIDPEDNFNTLDCLVYAYAMLGDVDAVNDLKTFLKDDDEIELVSLLVDFKSSKPLKISSRLRKLLQDDTSELYRKNELLWIDIPEFLENIKNF